MRPTTFNITTLLLLSLTVWILWVRHRTRLENNWPLLYYVALVAYLRRFEETLNSAVVFTAIVSALLLRFEFMAGWVLKVVMVIESICLVYVVVRALQLLFF